MTRAGEQPLDLIAAQPGLWRRALRTVMGPRAVLAAVAVGVVIRLAAALLTNADAVNLYEFGTIGNNVVGGHGYTYHAVGPDGRVQTDGQLGDAEQLTGPRLPSAFMPPGYTATVTVAIATAGDHATVVRLLQLLSLLAAAVGTLMIAALARLFAGPLAGRAAAWIFALYPPLIYVTTQVSAANFYVPLELALLVCLGLAARSPGLRPVVGAAAVLGVLCLFRSEAVLLVPLGALWLLLARRWYHQGRALTAAVVLVCVAVVLPGAWIVRNSLTFDRPVLTITTSGGFNLWIGNHDGATGSQKQYSTPAQTTERLDAVPVDERYETALDRVYLDEALGSIRRDPGTTVVRAVQKLGLTLGADVYDSRSNNLAYLAGWAVLLLLGVGGMFVYRRAGPLRWLLYGQLVLSLAIPTVFFALARNKLGAELVLIVFAGAFVARLAGRCVVEEPSAGSGPAGPAGLVVRGREGA